MHITYQSEDYDISTQYQNRGNDLIVFIHGGGCAKESFQDAFTQQQLSSYSLFSFDLLGHGHSSRPQDFSYTMEDHAEIAYLLLQQLNPAKIHIVAHSMGGAIGLLLAEKLNDKLASFISAEGNLISEDCNTSRIVSRIPYEEFKSSGFQKLKDKYSKSPDKIIRLWADWLELVDVYGLYHGFISLVQWCDSGKLPDIFKALPCKKIYLYGDKNSSAKSKLINQIKEIPAKSIPDSGHFMMLNNPKEFYNAVKQAI